MPITRRQFLSSSIAISSSTFLSPIVQSSTQQGQTKMKIICLEEHVLDSATLQASMPNALKVAPYLPDWGKTVQDGNNPDHSRPQVIANTDSSRKALDWEKERLNDMDKAGIDMQILSLGGFPQFAPIQDQLSLSQEVNDRLASTVAAHPNRFLAFATLPWSSPDIAIKELERAVTQLGLKGALLNGRPSDSFIDAPQYKELLSAFNTLKVPLYIHPGIPVPAVQQAYYSGFNPELSNRLSTFAWGWHNEAGIQLLRLMLSGAFDNNPHLTVISGHWGEMLPFYLQRLDDSIPLAASGLKRTLTQTFKDQIFVTPSGMLTQPHFNFIYSLLGAERILFSVDYPYQSLDGIHDFFHQLPISVQEKAMIAHQNVEKLFHI
ncbi:amidohydrolase family protein [Pelistega ratti]|uniref:amidohydrolase family protein n=1 Tax=Pelistega ratti TaxID=2652177 RepID=UPI001FAA14D9|nr:amidohydrolase family protein [Pelistega ratti]